VREINYLIDLNLPICRSWRSALTTEKGGNNPQVEVTGMGHLHFNILKYGKGTGDDNAHLSDQGAALFLTSLWTGYGQGLRDRNAVLDFPQCRPAVSVHPYQSTSFFNELQELRHQVTKDTSSVDTIMNLNVMEAYTVDVTSMNFTIRYQPKQDFLSSKRDNSYVQRTRVRNRKTEAFYKRKEDEETRNTGAHGNGPQQWQRRARC